VRLLVVAFYPIVPMKDDRDVHSRDVDRPSESVLTLEQRRALRHYLLAAAHVLDVLGKAVAATKTTLAAQLKSLSAY
jgi:hypothetical protein